MVTGALALLSEIYPSDSLADRKNRLLACTRQTAALTGRCRTGGVLDLSKMDSYSAVPAPTATAEQSPGANQEQNRQTIKKTPGSKKNTKKIRKIKFKKSSVKLKAGKKVKLKVVIKPSNAAKKVLRWSSSKKKWASVTQKGVVTARKKGRGHTVKITAAAKDGSGKKAVCKIKIKP